MKINDNNKGFTLIEMLVSMTIFVVFLSVLISSYTSIVSTQRAANEHRTMYAEARTVFETIVAELRDGMVDYKQEGNLVGAQDEILLVTKDALKKTMIRHEFVEGRGVLVLDEQKVVDPNVVFNVADGRVLNSEVNVKDFKLYVSPSRDPYALENVALTESQFQPKITIFAEFEQGFDDGRTFTFELQTSVSSRIYNQVY